MTNWTWRESDRARGSKPSASPTICRKRHDWKLAGAPVRHRGVKRQPRHGRCYTCAIKGVMERPALTRSFQLWLWNSKEEFHQSFFHTSHRQLLAHKRASFTRTITGRWQQSKPIPVKSQKPHTALVSLH